MTLVIDASALLFASTRSTAPARDLLARLGSEDVHAPHLIDAEVGNALRRMAARGEIDPRLARTLLHSCPLLVDVRHDHLGGLARFAWSLRDNLTFYDALYVALAAGLRAPLVTADRRLAAAPDLPCSTMLVRA